MNSGEALRFVAGALFISNMAIRKALSEQGEDRLCSGCFFVMRAYPILGLGDKLKGIKLASVK